MLALGSGQIIQNPWVQLFCLAGWSTPLSTTDCHQALLQLQPKIYALQTAGKCNNKSHFMRRRRRNSPFIGNANVAQNWTWHLNGQLTVTCARSLCRSSSLAPWSGLAWLGCSPNCCWTVAVWGQLLGIPLRYVLLEQCGRDSVASCPGLLCFHAGRMPVFNRQLINPLSKTARATFFFFICAIRITEPSELPAMCKICLP